MAFWWNNQVINNAQAQHNANSALFNGRHRYPQQNTGFGNFQNNNRQAMAGSGGQQNFRMNQATMDQQARQMPQGPISYETLDEKTAAQVKELIKKKQDELGIPPEDRKMPENLMMVGNEADFPVNTDEKSSEIQPVSKFAKIIQGERNAGLFYKSLLDLTTDDYIKNMLSEIINGAQRRKNTLSKLHNAVTGEAYIERDSEIIKPSNIRQALETALEIETASLRELAEFYDNTEDEHNLKIINSVIYKKLIDVNVLQQLARA